MLEAGTFKIDGKLVSFPNGVRGNEDLPFAMQFWMAYVARDLLQLGIFFRAATIMLQVPDGAQCRFVLDAETEENHALEWVCGADRNTLFNVLADCLRRLGASTLMKQVPGGKDYERAALSDGWKEFLDGQSKIKHGLQNVIGEILDELIVRPGMEEIDAVPQPKWWQTWRERIRDAPI